MKVDLRFIIKLLGCLFFYQVSLAQTTEKVSFGELNNLHVSIEEFRNQRQLKIPDNYLPDSAVIYFTIPGKEFVKKFNYFPENDTVAFNRICDQLVAGATANFHIFLKENGQAKQYTVHVGYAFYGLKKRSGILQHLL